MRKKELLAKNLIPIYIALATWSAWLTILSPTEALSNLVAHWHITVTMLFGSIIAGGTSLGGGAVAFPIFTKILHINPHDARIFSLAIQSVGMSAAAVAICLTGIRVEWRVICWVSLGGFVGISISTAGLTALLPPDVIKIYFTLLLTSFAIVLLGSDRGLRRSNQSIPLWTRREKIILLTVGLLGGIISGLVGNGIDICAFAVMVLLFRISEKVATPTSVILMAINAIAGFAIHVFIAGDLINPIQDYWLAAIPVVVFGAPLGAILGSSLSRQGIVKILICLIAIELITSLLLVPLRAIVIGSGIVLLMIFSCLNYWMYRSQMYQ